MDNTNYIRDFYVSVGNNEEFLKVMTIFVSLIDTHFPDEINIEVEVNHNKHLVFFYGIVDKRTKDTINSILNLYNPRLNPNNLYHRILLFNSDLDNVYKLLPSARERINSKNFLTSILDKYNLARNF